jgi:hypothetical protein
MAVVYRCMTKAEGHDLPEVRAHRDCLGVILKAPPEGDIPVDAIGNVHPGTGGMSVSDDWKESPHGRIPRRLRKFFPDAQGSNKFHLWEHEVPAFANGAFAEQLQLDVDGEHHATVQPSSEMSSAECQNAIAATQPQWRLVDESNLS